MERKSLCIRQEHPRLTTVFSGHPLSFQANMRIEAYAFGCKGSATFLNGQDKTRSLFCSHRHETQRKRTDENGHRACLWRTEDVKTKHALRGTRSGCHESSSIIPDSRPMTFSERRPAFTRVSSHVHSCLNPRSVMPRPAFAKRHRD